MHGIQRISSQLDATLALNKQVQSTIASCSSYDSPLPDVNMPSRIMKQCFKRFLVHHALDTCMACIVYPDQPVLCTPVQMFSTQLMHQTSHACCAMQKCQPSAGAISTEAEPEAAAAQEAHLQSRFHKGLCREMLLTPSGDSSAICCSS